MDELKKRSALGGECKGCEWQPEQWANKVKTPKLPRG